MDLKVPIPTLPPTTVITDSTIFPCEQDGITKRIDYSYMKTLLTGSDVITGSFDNTDLIANVWTLNHAKNTVDVLLFIKDPDGYFEFGVRPRIVDANNMDVDFGGAITGTYTYLFAYWNPGTTAAPTELTKKIDIGAWNLNTDQTILVAHGLDFSKILSVEVLIWNDSLTRRYNILGAISEAGSFAHGAVSVDDTDIALSANSSEWMALSYAGFTSLLVNRGVIYIRYES